MRLVRFLVVLASVGAIAAGPVMAQGKDKHGGKGKPSADHPKAVTVAITDVDVRLIREYYAGKGAKPKPLPPGIAKNLARGKPLPPGIAKKRLPDALIVRLPARPNYEWIMAGNVIVLVDPVGIVVDVLKEIF